MFTMINLLWDRGIGIPDLSICISISFVLVTCDGE